MPLTISDLRQFAGTDRMTFDARSCTMQTATRWQRFKIFFNIGDARQRNAETLTAISNALLNDARFSATDLQAQVARLLGDVRTNRAIDAARIQSVVQELDRLAANNAIGERVTLRLATRPLQGALRNCTDAVAGIAAGVARNDPAARQSPGRVDIPGILDRTIAACEKAMGSAKAINEAAPDERMLRFVSEHLQQFVQKRDGSLRDPDAIETLVRGYAGFFHQALEESNNDHQLGRLDIAMKFLETTADPATPELYQALDAYVKAVPLDRLRSLGPASSADEIVDALRAFSRDTLGTNIRLPAGFSMPSLFGGDHYALTAYIRESVALRLSEDERQTLLAALKTPAAAVAFDLFYHYAQQMSEGAASDGEGATRLYTVLCELRDKDAEVVLPGVQGTKAHGRVRANQVRTFDFGALSPAARCAYQPADAITGPAADRLRSALLDPLAVPDRSPAAVLHERIDAGASKYLDGSFAKGMKAISAGDFAAFDALLADGARRVELPGPDPFPTDPAAARDRIARFATGRADAAYATLAPEERARVNVLLALIADGTARAAAKGIPAGLSAQGGSAFEAVGEGRPSPRIEITGSLQSGFAVHCDVIQDAQSIRVGDETVPAGDHGSVRYRLDIRLSPADLDRLAAVDWSAFDPAAFDGAAGGASLDAVGDAVPAPFRMGGELSASFHIRTTDAH